MDGILLADADDNEKKMAELVKQVEQLSAENLDKEDDADAKNDEVGVRTRRVTAAALHALIKKVMPGQKDYTFLDEAKLIAYFTNYSTNRLRTDISGSDTFNSRQATEIEKVNELFNLDLPISDEYATIGGLILFHNEDFPKENQDIEIDNYKFHIQRTSKTKISLVKLTISPD